MAGAGGYPNCSLGAVTLSDILGIAELWKLHWSVYATDLWERLPNTEEMPWVRMSKLTVFDCTGKRWKEWGDNCSVEKEEPAEGLLLLEGLGYNIVRISPIVCLLKLMSRWTDHYARSFTFEFQRQHSSRAECTDRSGKCQMVWNTTNVQRRLDYMSFLLVARLIILQ